MSKELLTTAEFAEITQTTKRAIQLYDKIGLLLPQEKGENGYRYYSSDQFLDYNIIYLLSQLGVSLSEIKKILNKEKSFKRVFESQQSKLEKELEKLEYSLNTTRKYIKNINTNGSFLDPKIVHKPALDILYIQKTGKYDSIRFYIIELLKEFDKEIKNPILLKIHSNKEKDLSKYTNRFMIGVLVTPEIKKINYNEEKVKLLKIDSKRYLKAEHQGSQRILSSLWIQMHKLAKKKKIKLNKKYPFNIEIYTKFIFNEYPESFKHETEMLLPTE